MPQNAADKRWMALALSLAQRGLGQTWPNPSVGCVIVKNGRVLGRGHTQQGGRPHAEVMALRQAGNTTNGATAYVTLEPCSHTGQTPPCASALINAGLSRVVIATTDPDPRVAGRGIQMLRNAGIEITMDVLKSDADIAHAGFFSRVTQNKPFITLKLAISLDGRIATQTGDSQWITDHAARRYVHYLRATHDAVMVGRGTVNADDPTLNVRGFGSKFRQPVRIIMDSNISCKPVGNLATTAHDTPVWLCHTQAADFTPWANTGAISVACNAADGRVDITDAMSQLANAGLTRVFCEGGGTLGGALIKAGLVDQLIIMQAGVAIGADGKPSLGKMGNSVLKNAPRFVLNDVRQIGPDTISIWHKP
jgi:diaminohydroxyphosphoribosylaminopyrimidine deaminase/5-amino-6-(5-phosphoribosylamino)uracil reductase